MSLHRVSRALALAGALMVGAAPARAQLGVSLEGGAVHALPPAGTTGEALTYGTLDLHGLFTPGPRWTLSGGVSGALALEGGGDWLVGDLAAVGRRPVGRRAALELTTTLAAFRVSNANVYEALVARLVPVFRWRAGRTGELAVRGHAGVGRSTSHAAGSPFGVEEKLALGGAGVEGSVLVGPARLSASSDGYRSDEGSFWSLIAGGEAPLGPARLEAQLQLWSAPEVSSGDRVVFLGSIRVPLGGRASLRSSGGRSAPDPLLGTLPGTYGSALVHVDLPLGRSPVDEPAATLLAPAEGRVEFRWRGDAASVEVSGDFTGWEPLPLRAEDDLWSVVAVVPPGAHHFGFRVDGEWQVPERVLGRALDEWGRPVGTVVVPERSASPVMDGQAPADPAGSLPPAPPDGEGWRVRLEAAERAGIPHGPLLARAREARAKGAAPAEVLGALDAWARELGRARELVGAAEPTADLTAAADAIRRGVPEQAIRELVPALMGFARTLSLVALGDLVAQGVSPQAAFDLVYAAGGRGDALELLPAVPPVVRRLVRQGTTAEEAALQVEDAIARGVPPPFVELGAGGWGGKPPVPPGTGAPRMMGGMMRPGGG